MAWFKVDDKLHVHRKTRRALTSDPTKKLDAAAMGLWVLAGSWCSQNSDNTGWIPEHELDRWDDNWQPLAGRLVDAKFWKPETVQGEPGYAFHNYRDYLPPNVASAKGKEGNHKRWHVDKGIVSEDCELCMSDQ